MKRFLLIVLAASLYAGTAAADDRAPKPPPPPPKSTEPARTRREAPKLSAEDREVVENLELLESMDTASDLELLMEISKDEDSSSPP